MYIFQNVSLVNLDALHDSAVHRIVVAVHHRCIREQHLFCLATKAIIDELTPRMKDGEHTGNRSFGASRGSRELAAEVGYMVCPLSEVGRRIFLLG